MAHFSLTDVPTTDSVALLPAKWREIADTCYGGPKELMCRTIWSDCATELEAALATEHYGAEMREAFVAGYKHGACHYIGGNNTQELEEAARWAVDHQDAEVGVFLQPSGGKA